MIRETASLKQRHIDYLLSLGVPPMAIISPDIPALTEADGQTWLCFEEQQGHVLWQPRSGEVRAEAGDLFALGEDLIANPAATALDQWLCVYADPLRWLQASRRGIVVLRWPLAFERLRDVPRIAVDEPLIENYQRHMRPRLPSLAVIPKGAAA